jgi:hypothetical protein
MKRSPNRRWLDNTFDKKSKFGSFLFDNVGNIVYTIIIRIRRTGEFDKWLIKLRDNTGKALILDRIRRLEDGNRGDWKPIEETCLKCVSVSGLVTGCIVRTPDKKSSSCCAGVISPHSRGILNGQRK